MVYPKQFSASIVSLMFKIDKQVREFNDLKQKSESASKAPLFSSFWHKIVDMDETDVEIRYNSQTIVKEDQRDELPKGRNAKPMNKPRFKTIDYEPDVKSKRP